VALCGGPFNYEPADWEQQSNWRHLRTRRSPAGAQLLAPRARWPIGPIWAPIRPRQTPTGGHNNGTWGGHTQTAAGAHLQRQTLSRRALSDARPQPTPLGLLRAACWRPTDTLWPSDTLSRKAPRARRAPRATMMNEPAARVPQTSFGTLAGPANFTHLSALGSADKLEQEPPDSVST